MAYEYLHRMIINCFHFVLTLEQTINHDHYDIGTSCFTGKYTTRKIHKNCIWVYFP